MKDFVFAALPFLIIGVCVAIIMVHYKTKDSEKKENHLVEGMCIGMCLGVAVSTVLLINIGLGISLGMLIGETVGVYVKKE